MGWAGRGPFPFPWLTVDICATSHGGMNVQNQALNIPALAPILSDSVVTALEKNFPLNLLGSVILKNNNNNKNPTKKPHPSHLRPSISAPVQSGQILRRALTILANSSALGLGPCPCPCPPAAGFCLYIPPKSPLPQVSPRSSLHIILELLFLLSERLLLLETVLSWFCKAAPAWVPSPSDLMLSPHLSFL